MAASSEILLPEVHLNSPIVKHKLIYYLLLGHFPHDLDISEISPLHNNDWDQIAREESNLAERLGVAKSELIKRVPAFRATRWRSHAAVLIWPSCIPFLVKFLPHSKLQPIEQWYKLINASCNTISDSIDRCMENISIKLTGKNNLFSRSRGTAGAGKNSKITLNDIQSIWESNKWQPNVSLWLTIKYQMRQLIMHQSSRQPTDLVHIVDTRSGLIVITPELVICFDRLNSVLMYFTFEMTLMVSDMFEGRMNVTALCTISHYLSPLGPRIDRLFSIVDELAQLLGDTVYKVIASLESLVYGCLQLKDPVVEVAGSFHSFITQEIIDILIGSKALDKDESITVTTQLLDIFSNLSPDLIAEMLCLMRLWGHPTLTAAQAAGKVRESMCAGKLLDFPTIMKTLAFFHTILINGYRRKKNGMWPPLILPKNASKSLIEFQHDNAEISYEYTLKHWKEISLIEFRKCFDFDPGEELSIFMKDKAISAPRSDWMSVFRRSLIKQRHQRHHIPMPNPFNRRLLLNFLEDDSFDPVAELQYVTSGEYLQDDTFCASYSLKEKEIKPDGRIFAKLTNRMRSCQVIAEAILANHAGTLMKENGVVLNQLSLTKSLLTMSQIGIISEKAKRYTRDNISTQGFHTIKTDSKNKRKSKTASSYLTDPDDTFELSACFITTDLAKYCLQWRYQTIIHFARTLNRMYGVPHLFEWIHLRLIRSTLYVGDPFNPPAATDAFDLDKVLNGDIFIVSPKGGIEGLCQKMWTMISISVIILSSAESKTRVMSMVQGDNQAIAVTTRVPRSLPSIQKKELAYAASKLFFERLRANNYGLGHQLKAQETIISSTFFIYSKRVFYQGRILTQALKNASKLCLTADVLGECTQASCSNSATTIMRLTENGVEKDTCYKLNIYQSIRQLTYDLIFPQYSIPGETISGIFLQHPRLISRIVLLPSQLGGLNYLACSRLFNRNIGDPLGTAVADLKRLIKCGALESWILYNLLARKPGKGSWATLAADPYSLNQEYLYPPTTILKRHTQHTLMEICRNPMLKGVFTDNAKEEENLLAKFLLDRDIVLPRVAHIIIDQSSIGRKKQIQGFFDTTRTIMRRSFEIKPLSTKKTLSVIEYNTNYLSYNYPVILNPLPIPGYLNYITDQTCSIDISRSLRKLSWSSLLNGRTLEGLETPDPIEVVNGSLIVGTGDCDFCMQGDDKFTWFFLPMGIIIDGNPETNPPIRVPYIGSRTEERRVASMAYIKGATHSLKAALRGAGVYIWAFGDTIVNWNDALDIANTRVKISLEQLQTLTPLPTSANITHRLDDGATTLKFTPASSYAFSSYTHISNDQQYLEIDQRVVDSNIIYQQLMITGLGIIETYHNPPIRTSTQEITLHLHTSSSCCVRSVDGCLICESNGEVPQITVPYTNTFVYDPDPLADYEIAHLDYLSYQAKIGSTDYYSLTDKIDLLAHLTAKQMINSIIGLDETVSIVNDAVILSDYTNNWISECSYTKIDLVFKLMAWNFLLELAFQMYYLRISSWTNIFDYTYMTLRRIPGTALNNIAATISHPKLLRRAMNLDIITPIHAPYLASLDYVKLSIDAIQWGVKQVLADLSNGIDLEILILSEDSMEISDRAMNLIARKLTLLALVKGENYTFPKIKGMPPEEKCLVLTEYLAMCYQNTHHLDPDLQKYLYNLTNPKLTAFPSNNFYLTRKILNQIRESDEGQYIITSYYESFEQLETDIILHSTLTAPYDNSETLTKFDLSLDIFPHPESLEKYPLPVDHDSQSAISTLIPGPPSHHVLRPLGVSSTAWYKGISYCRYLETQKIQTGDHLYLAEGSGASMSLLELLFPGDTVYYNSLFSSGENPPQRNYAPLPTQFVQSVPYKLWQADLADDSNLIKDFIPLWNGNGAVTDLSTKDAVAFIIHKVGAEKASLVHIDLESTANINQQTLSRSQIHSLIIATTVLKRGGILIYKTSWLPFSRFSQLASLLWCFFDRIHLIRSSYSDPHSHEVYLVCRLAADFRTIGFSAALVTATTLHNDGFTTIHPDVVCNYWQHHLENVGRVGKVIDEILDGLATNFFAGDNGLILRCGGTPSSRKWLEIDQLASFDLVQDALVTLITIHLKEIIEVQSSHTEDYTSLLFTPYNIGAAGKVRTIIKLILERSLMYTVRNWLVLPSSIRDSVRQDLELGSFRLMSILSEQTFLKKTPTKKYLLDQLTRTYISTFFNSHSVLPLHRPYQKQIWKALGSVIYCSETVDIPLIKDIQIEDINDFEDIERGIDGEEL
uniref:RNA-directed RNA polymerase L n=1 Tax=Human parainfluenza 2 virus TaxID=2560525 RepID=A0A3Q9JNX7_PI2H|nr:RNA-dependent RNA polymerase [Human orthorubulavirus 2]